MSQIYVITGASRGIGLEYVKQISNQEGNIVYAGARNPEGSKDLMALVDNKKVFVFSIDVTSEESIKAAAAKVSETATGGIDILINNAGISSSLDKTILNASKAEYVRVFETNVSGVSDVTQAFLPLLRKSKNKVKKIVNISSILASIAESDKMGTSGSNSAYNVSKAALNMLTKMFANVLASESFIVVAVHPGWVQTDMGGKSAPLQVTDSVKGQLTVIDSLTDSDNGRFMNYEGQTIPW